MMALRSQSCRRHCDAIKLTKCELDLRNSLMELVGRLPRAASKLAKQHIRRLHAGKRIELMATMNGSFKHHLDLLRANLAKPCDIAIEAIAPSLHLVKSETLESELFNAVSLLWSVPVSKGFGRRMRYLVKDATNGKLIGIIGLTDPVFNLTARDTWIGWSSQDRAQRLIHVMDAFVLGAVPPYSKILGGKLVALLATSKEVVRHFRRKYRDYQGVISSTKKDPHLVLLTTSSALGRSSLYNRLRIPGSVEYLTEVETERVSAWYTQGYGHFHIPDDMFRELQNVLVRRHHPYATGNRFGDGPNWKIRVIRKAARELRIDAEVLRHGIKRQVYVAPLASNARAYLCGQAKCPRYMNKTITEITDFWRTRWAMPRSQRYPDWLKWNMGGLITTLSRLHNRLDENERLADDSCEL